MTEEKSIFPIALCLSGGNAVTSTCLHNKNDFVLFSPSEGYERKLEQETLILRDAAVAGFNFFFSLSPPLSVSLCFDVATDIARSAQ